MHMGRVRMHYLVLTLIFFNPRKCVRGNVEKIGSPKQAGTSEEI